MFVVDIDAKGVKAKIDAAFKAIEPQAISYFNNVVVAQLLQLYTKERFAGEGDTGGVGTSVGQWAELATYTKYDRKRRGFQPDHPINVRTGGLKDWVTGAQGMQVAQELFIWPAKLPPNNSSMHFAYACAQTGRTRSGPHPPRKIAAVGQYEAETFTQMLGRRVTAAMTYAK
jgi:hypothetical protein